MTRLTLGLLLALASAPAVAAPPCPGVAVAGSAASPSEAAAVGRQISNGALPIDRKLSVGPWSVFHVKPKSADALWLFFKGDPARTQRIYLSPGLGRPDEYGDIKMEVEQNAPGIPAALSSCFAHLVTGG
ncbi:MAG: hypothetical protein DI565_06610 [Ancylobacter novellus]|uniref:Uncharacterized protein n=1 Tax=Ancylobacter novellus TaxID=921 RepID=A0A2W5KJ76_ANCNO|nr:MAG: hypothetical protein DI565_06610 [Ancylobacter novellus]